MKGQSSVEYILLLAVLFFVLVTLLVFAYGEYRSFENEAYILQGRMAAEKLCTGVDHISDFDEGSIEYIKLTLPRTYIAPESFAINNIINLNIGGSDVNCITSVEVSGILPDNAGPVLIKVQRTKHGVVIG